MNQRLDAGEPALASDSTLDGAQAYVADPVVARNQFSSAFAELSPPEEAQAIWTTLEGEEFWALDEEATALCAAARADIDAPPTEMHSHTLPGFRPR